MEVLGCPGLPPCLEHLSRQVDELCPLLERFCINDCSFLTTSFCRYLTSLQRLEVCYLDDEVMQLTGEQERALQLLTSLRELLFEGCNVLADLPMGLHSLTYLKTLEISWCRGISSLQEKDLPPSPEELQVSRCSNDLDEQCRALATTKLRVKIDWKYVN
ncbi:hypothetical protein ACP4OV_026386 [Aristida adscensionis]